MTLYHFDVSQNGGPWEEDDDGTDLSGPDQARLEAVALAHILSKMAAHLTFLSGFETVSLHRYSRSRF